MKSQIIILAALAGIIFESVILIKSIFDIIKAAKKGIVLTALSNKLVTVWWGVLGAAGIIFLFVYPLKGFSDCKKEIADYRERGSAVYTDKFDESSIGITVPDEDKFTAQNIELLEKRAERCFAEGLMMIFWVTTAITCALCNLVFVTREGIVLISQPNKKDLFADREENYLRINKKTKSGTFPVCKIKDTPENREILTPYIK